eukprot:1161641-Pelagomonas_calceolata.AAC.1
MGKPVLNGGESIHHSLYHSSAQPPLCIQQQCPCEQPDATKPSTEAQNSHHCAHNVYSYARSFTRQAHVSSQMQTMPMQATRTHHSHHSAHSIDAHASNQVS